MVIWIVNHYAEPPEGLSTRSFDLARRMVERGHSVTIVASNFSHYHLKQVRELSVGRLWQAELVDGVKFIWVKSTPYSRNGVKRVVNMCSFACLAVLAGATQKPRPDVVSGVTVHPLAALSGYVLARLFRARYFVEVTDLWPQTLIDFHLLSEKSVVARAMRWLERFLYRRAERLLMLWRHTEEYVGWLGVDPRKVLWVPHGVEPNRYSDLKPYDGAPDRPLRIMYLGAFVTSMAIDTILEAARILRDRGREDIEFLLVGAGEHHQTAVDRAGRLGLSTVSFPPPVSKARLGSVMNRADAFIYGLRDLPLYRYGMSLNKLTDYLIGGRPIIFFGRSSYDPVRDAGAGFSVAPDDPEGVADAAERLVALTVEDRKTMGYNGHQWALRHHSIPTLAGRVLEAYEERTR